MKFQDKFKPGDIICSDRGELKMSNIHGTCPHCNANLDGDLIIDYPLSQGKSKEEALNYAAMFAGWNEHGEANRWGRAIGLYSMEKDCTIGYRCPDCNKTWERE